MRTSNKFDSENNEIFEGDKVIHLWGWFTWNSEHKSRYRIHTITVNDAYLMGDGQMHDDGGGIIFCLGKSYNFWEGKTVTKLTATFGLLIKMKTRRYHSVIPVKSYSTNALSSNACAF